MRLDKIFRSLISHELKLVNYSFKQKTNTEQFWVVKRSQFEVCPRCATKSYSVYDHRKTTIKDAPLRERRVLLHINKRRFFCKTCSNPFTEPIGGIKKKCRTTQRFREFIFSQSQTNVGLNDVRKRHKCSSRYIYQTLYEGIENKRLRNQCSWPSTIGIDEHFFKRNQTKHYPEFVTIIIDYDRNRMMELVDGKKGDILRSSLDHIPGREKVKHITMDLCETYRSFCSSYFKNCKIVADKFHVLRLFSPIINQYRKAVTGDRRGLPVRRVLLTNNNKLSPGIRDGLHEWLEKHPELKQIYRFKEDLHLVYRIKKPDKARAAFITLLDRMSTSLLPEIKRLRNTLNKWKTEILNYFETKITNGKTEGYNNKAKLIKRCAYGFRSFKHYRLKLLAACG